MCIIGMSIHQSKEFPFIMWANRDEFYRRESKELHYRMSHPRYIGGKDLKKGGSWLGFDPETGNIAVVTNIRKGFSEKKNARSRGELIDRFFKSGSQQMRLDDKQAFNGFNLIYGNVFNQLYHDSSDRDQPVSLNTGIHGISNGTMNESWPKTDHIKRELAKVDFIESEKEMIKAGFSALQNGREASAADLPDTGIGMEMEKKLSPVYISLQEYGTVCSTILLLDKYNRATMLEHRYKDEKTMAYHWPVKSENELNPVRSR